MHILLVHQAFASLDEAGGTRHYEMAQRLAQQGHRVTVLCSPVNYLTGKGREARYWVKREQPEDGITLLRTYVYPVLHKSFLHRLINFFSFMVSSFLVGLSVRKVDAVWGTSPPIFQGVTAWLLARLKGAKFLFEVRDLWPEFAIAVGVLRNPILIRLSYWLERFLYRHADQLVVNSPGFIQYVNRWGKRPVELVANGVDTSMFDPGSDGSDFRKAHGLEQVFVALYAGAHGLSNDLDVILHAADKLKHRSDIRFVLVGDGKEKANLQRKAQEMGLGNLVFLPSVPKNQMAEVLAGMDAGIAILKPLEMYKTTYPNKVFDYMAAGRPVVLAIDGVIREVVEQAKAGMFVTPGDPLAMAEAVAWLADHREEARQQGLAGRKAVENCFERREQAQKMVLLFLKMVERGASLEKRYG